ncbi:MAG: DUF4440 domain-containing protein [Candidatus Aminicenantaceae bacterium]
MKKLFMVLPLVLLLCFTFSCQQGEEVAEEPVTDVEADVEAIKNLRAQYMVSQDAGDAEGCVSYWDEDGALMPPNEPSVVGKESLLSWYQTAFDHVKIDFKVSFDQIEVADDWGFVRGGYEGAIIPKPEGEPIPDKGKYLEILKRQPDGSWKFACHMYSSDNSLEPPEEN